METHTSTSNLADKGEKEKGASEEFLEKVIINRGLNAGETHQANFSFLLVLKNLHMAKALRLKWLIGGIFSQEELNFKWYRYSTR